MRPVYVAIGIMVVASLLGASAQVLFKKANPQLDLSLLTNWLLVAGIGLYVVAFVLNLIAYRFGPASTTYAVVALSYCWVVLLSAFFLGESLTWQKVVGAAGIVASVALMFL